MDLPTTSSLAPWKRGRARKLVAKINGGERLGERGEKHRETPTPNDATAVCRNTWKWLHYPMGQFYFCVVNASDGGKACSDDGECQGNYIPAARKDNSRGICTPTLLIPGGGPKHLINGNIDSEPCIRSCFEFLWSLPEGCIRPAAAIRASKKKWKIK